MAALCTVCGGAEFAHRPVLWSELVTEWGLSEREAGYIEHQQGTSCQACGAQIRGNALASAILACLGETRPLREAISDPRHRRLAVADLNGCAGVSESFAGLPNYHRLDFPTFDMQSLPFAGGTFDLVIHSDSLEHVPDPLRALRECLRILKPGGHLCFTAPVILDRLSKGRAGLPASYHGGPGDRRDDFLLHTEFGSDIWQLLAEASAGAIGIHMVDFPAGIAWSAAPSTAIKSVSVMSTEQGKLPPAAPVEEAAVGPNHIYDQDGLRSHHNHEFMDDGEFRRAYARGVQAAGEDYKWHWRVHVGLWGAKMASLLPGDFVECGVNRGFLSSAIMELLDWDSTGRVFYLLDTFSGIDPRYVSETERVEGIMDRNRAAIDSGFYVTSLETVEANFAQWRNKRIVVGSVPETLHAIASSQIAFLSLDMNCMPPEVAALEYLWDRLVDGAVVLFDDYAYYGYRQQKLGIDACAERLGVPVLSLPTGQGLIIRPPRSAASLS